MKKIILILVIICMFIGGVVLYTPIGETVNQEVLARKMIRFHVIANSDSIEDQNLKLKVRDEILKYIYPKLKVSKELGESRKILENNEKEIGVIADKVIQNNGYNYKVKVQLSYENFPIKTYGNITLPQGRYEAFRVIIGEGRGKNWWCVMFPPLCFIDITKGEVAKTETEKEMRTVLSKEEYEAIDNSKNSIEVQFKIVNIIKDLLKQ